MDRWQTKQELYVRLTIDAALIVLIYSAFLWLRYEMVVPGFQWIDLLVAFAVPIFPAHLASNYLLADYRPSLAARRGLDWRLLLAGIMAGFISTSFYFLPVPLFLELDAPPISVILFGSVVTGVVGPHVRHFAIRSGWISFPTDQQSTDGAKYQRSDLLRLLEGYRAQSSDISQRAGVLLGLSGVFVGLIREDGTTTRADRWTLWFAAVAAIASLFALVMPNGAGDASRIIPPSEGHNAPADLEESGELPQWLLELRRTTERRGTALLLGALALGGAIIGAVGAGTGLFA